MLSKSDLINYFAISVHFWKKNWPKEKEREEKEEEEEKEKKKMSLWWDKQTNKER